MNFNRYGIDPDPKTVEVRMKALADEGLTPESFGVTDFQLRYHLDPTRSRCRPNRGRDPARACRRAARP
jgi:hypothetical protein